MSDENMGTASLAVASLLFLLAVTVVFAIVIGCEVKPDIQQLQEALCERLEATPNDYQDCLEELR